jgi:hypothetical protein
MSPIAQYALQGVAFSAALLVLVWGCRYLFVRDDSSTVVEMKKRSWR